MNKKNKSRELILKGLTMHLDGKSLKNIYAIYDKFYIDYKFSQKDKSFVKYITIEAITNRGTIEIILNNYLTRPLPKKISQIKAGMMLGITQIVFSKVESYASVNTTVELFKGRIFKWRALANAVLRKVDKDKAVFLNIKDREFINTPKWLLEKWFDQFGKPNTIKIIQACNKNSTIDIKFKEKFSYNIEYLKGKVLGNNTVRIYNQGPIKELKGYNEGEWWVQDIAAQIPALCLGNIKNKTVIDLCAAPGGKTCQLLDLGANVIAIDKSEERIKILQENAKRLKLHKNLKTVCKNILTWNPQLKSSLILLDAPCTATGTIRRHPDIIWHKSKVNLINLIKTQKKLLSKAIKMLEDNGTLIYSNCSMEFEEGEFLIKDIIKEGLVKLDNINKNEINGFPEEIFNGGVIRTLPFMNEEFGGMDGFFIARLKKISHN